MRLRLRLMALLIMASLAVVVGRLAQLQLIEPEKYLAQPFQNHKLERKIAEAIADGAITPGVDDTVSIAPGRFRPWETRYIKRLAIKGILRGRDGHLFVESGFTRRLPSDRGGDPAALIRGRILDRNGRRLAWTAIENGRRVRHYALPEACFHLLGSNRADRAQPGIETFCDAVLRTPDPSLAARWRSFWLGPRPGLDVRTTLDSRLQEVAWRALEGKKGALVAIDPTTGDLLAVVTSPSLSSSASSREVFAAHDAGPDGPLLNRAFDGYYPPGSTFKTIVAAAVLGDNVIDLNERLRCDGMLRPIPGAGYTIHDHEYGLEEGFRGHHPSAGPGFTLADAYAVSCNVTFARLGMLTGADRLTAWAKPFGFGRAIPVRLLDDTPAFHVIPSRVFPAGTVKKINPAQLAQTAIGQFEVRATPLQMALVAAAVANDGVIMIPRLVSGAATPAGRWVTRTRPDPWLRPLLPDQAKVLKRLMRSAITDGTGRRLASESYMLAGKTGTAEIPGSAPHGWFIAFAPANAPRIAVAALVEHGGYGSASAGPIARAVIDTWLGDSEATGRDSEAPVAEVH